MDDRVVIDGSHGEGGGQILRTSLALAVLTGRPLVIENIRAGRAKPGLAAQHLASVRAAATLCQAKLAGDYVGSQRLEFHPRAPVTAGDHRFEIGTAGATPLVAQTVALPLALAGAPSRVTITGGTHVSMAPTADFLDEVYGPALADLGVRVAFKCEAAGFFPKGGGRLELKVEPREGPVPFDWTERGRLTGLRAIAVAPGLPDHVAKRGLDAARKGLQGVGRPCVIERRDPPSPFPGAAMLISGSCQRGYFGFVALGSKGKPMEAVATEAVEAFWAWWKSGATTDEHLADQLVLPAALAHGESRWTTSVPSLHLETGLWVVQQFLPVEAAIAPHPTGALVTVRGAGLVQG